MIKTKTVIEVKVNERIYELYLGPDSPLGECHDALMHMKGLIVDKMVEAHKKENEACEKQKELDKEPEPV